MGPPTFDYILEKIRSKLRKLWKNCHGNPITIEEKLVITLRIMDPEFMDILMDMDIVLYSIPRLNLLDVTDPYAAGTAECILEGPRFLLEPPPWLEYTNSSGAILSCSARGNPQPTITWLDQMDKLVTHMRGVSHKKKKIVNKITVERA
uniref:Ig-like domain-containing protein n=1 Tax=Rhodnius prolixus TaxID=13249 RepID=T1I469_RHOPR